MAILTALIALTVSAGFALPSVADAGRRTIAGSWAQMDGGWPTVDLLTLTGAANGRVYGFG